VQRLQSQVGATRIMRSLELSSPARVDRCAAPVDNSWRIYAVRPVCAKRPHAAIRPLMAIASWPEWL